MRSIANAGVLGERPNDCPSLLHIPEFADHSMRQAGGFVHQCTTDCSPIYLNPYAILRVELATTAARRKDGAIGRGVLDGNKDAAVHGENQPAKIW